MSSKRDPKIWIGDILDSIQEIEDTVSNVEVVNFCENHVLINAVSYALLKITEATKHLLQSDIELPSNEPWTDIYSLGNQLRHGYFGIDQDQIWHVVTQDLPSLKATCEALLNKLES